MYPSSDTFGATHASPRWRGRDHTPQTPGLDSLTGLQIYFIDSHPRQCSSGPGCRHKASPGPHPHSGGGCLSPTPPTQFTCAFGAASAVQRPHAVKHTQQCFSLSCALSGLTQERPVPPRGWVCSMAGEQGGLRSAAAVSRVSFEPLSEFRENGGLSRDGSGLSMESASCEYESWRVRPPAAARPPAARLPPLGGCWPFGRGDCCPGAAWRRLDA